MRSAKAPRYLVWSTKAIVLFSLPMVLLTAVLVFWLSESSAWIEWQLTLLVLSICLFAFLTVGLYRGVRLERPKPTDADSPKLAPFDAVVDIATVIGPVKVDMPDLPVAGDDLVGCLLSAVFWLVATIFFAIVFWLAMQILIVALPALLLGTYWIYYRALRIVFAKSRVCKGQIWRSLGYGLLYTTLYMGWLFVVTWLGWFVFASRRVG